MWCRQIGWSQGLSSFVEFKSQIAVRAMCSFISSFQNGDANTTAAMIETLNLVT